MKKVLLVEDDRPLAEVVTYNLRKEGYEVVTAGDGIQGLETARREKPDLVLLDIMLPGLDGLELCRLLRKESNVPIIMLTARVTETDKIVGLEVGADDYITKPFSVKELMARVRASLRRAGMSQMPGDTIIKAGDIQIDIPGRLVTLAGKPVELTPREFDLLAYLAQNHGLVLSREQILEKVWGWEFAGDTKTVDVHVSWLRRKLESDPSQPQYIITVRGAGYRFGKWVK
jgi:two-component system OmpR family response regulator